MKLRLIKTHIRGGKVSHRFRNDVWALEFGTREKRDLAAYLIQRAVDLLEEAYRGPNGNVELAYQNKKWVERAAVVMRELEKLQVEESP